MKNKIFNTLGHKLQWLVLLVALLGLSQGVWAYNYPANTDVYVKSSTYYSTVKLYAWYNDGSDHNVSEAYPGSVMTYVGKINSNYYWKIQFTHYFSKMIVCDGSSNKISGDNDGEVSSSLDAKNCISVTGSSYTWEAFDLCNAFAPPANVVNGTNMMFYIYMSYNDNALCIYNGTNYISGTYTGTTKTYYINTAKSNITGKTINVSNNCSGGSPWPGEGGFTNVAAGSKLNTGSSISTTGARTLSKFTVSSSSITEGTSSIDLTLKISDEKSSNNQWQFALIYVGSTKVGCIAFRNTSDNTYTLNTSSLTVGSYTIKALLTDGTIYYWDSTEKSLEVTSACTDPDEQEVTTNKSSICVSSSETATISCSAQSGYYYQLAIQNGASWDDVGDPETESSGSVSFSASVAGTYKVYAYSGAHLCETDMSNTVTITDKAPTIEPSTNIKAYMPVTVTGTSNSTWTISTNPSGLGWLSSSSGAITIFKAPYNASNYAVTDNYTNCAVTISVGQDSETCP